MNLILIVDNIEESLYLLRVLLQGHGYTVATAVNGADALDMARRNPPDLIISAILMPIMDGFSLCREWMKDQRLKTIPFIFYTATYTDERDREFALSLGAKRFIVKPEEPDAFMAIIQETMQSIGFPPDAPSRTEANIPIETPLESSEEDESGYLKLYSETLIRKLEQNMEQLKQANSKLEQEMLERQEAENRLRESERRFSTVFHKSPLSITIARLNDNCFLDVNDAFLKTTGFTREEAIGHTPFELNLWFDPDERDRLVNQAAEKGAVTGFDMKLRKKSGEIARLLFSSELIELGGEICMLSMALDISERIKIEETLRKHEEKYRLIATNTADVITVTDMDLRTVFVSPSVERLRGFTAEEVMKQTLEQIMTPESLRFAQKVMEEEKELEASGTADRGRTRIFEVEEYKKDGSTIWVETAASFLRDRDGKATGILAIARDITERKRALHEREQLMAAIEQSGETIFITDAAGTILYVNPAFTRTTGYSREEAIGQTPRLLKSGKQNEAFYRELWAIISAGKSWKGHMVNRRKNGTFFTEAATISPVCDAAGHIVNYVAIKRDITKQLSLEAQFLQAQKMEAIGVLAGGVAHDFNNLLMVINGYAEILAKDFEPNDPKRLNLEEIINAGRQAASLITQLMAFSRKQVHMPKILNLNDVLDETAKMLRRMIGENIKITITAQSDLRPIYADPGQIQQILMNLSINARDAMPKGGSLTIKTADVTFDEEYARQHTPAKAGSYVMLAISDTGIGMDAATQARIFEPFFTTKGMGKGTGLGLSTIYGIVQQSNGFIWVHSEAGKGATFKIFFPRAEGEIVKATAKDTSHPGLWGHETVLVVEDEVAVRNLVCRILRGQGYNILDAPNGKEALSIARQYRDVIHLVLSDIIMPGMSGKELISQLESARPGIKRLYFSGYTDNAIVHDGALDPGVAFLQKPFTIEDLVRKVRDVLDS